jgi:hypothetical protein
MSFLIACQKRVNIADINRSSVTYFTLAYSGSVLQCKWPTFVANIVRCSNINVRISSEREPAYVCGVLTFVYGI